MGKSPKKATSKPAKTVQLPRVSPNPKEASGFTATTETPVASVSKEREVRVRPKPQEEKNGSSPGERYQHHYELEEAGPSATHTTLSVPRQRNSSGTKRKSDEFRPEADATENEDHSIDATTASAMTSLFLSPLKKLTTEDITRGTSKSERVSSGVGEASVPTRNATSSMSEEFACLTATTQDVNRDKTAPYKKSVKKACPSVTPRVTSTSTIYSEQSTTRMPQSSPDDSVARILRFSPTETPHKVDTGEGDRQQSGCGKSTSATSEAASQNSTANLTHREDAVSNPQVYDSEAILAEMIAQDYNTSWFRSAAETTLFMSSEELAEMTFSSSELEDPDTPDSATPQDVPEVLLQTYEFQRAAAGGQSASCSYDTSKLSRGQQSGYDGNFSSAQPAAATWASTNVVTSPPNISAQGPGVCDLYPNMASSLEGSIECASSTQSTCLSGFEKVPQTAPTQPTAGGYEQPSGDLVGHLLQQARGSTQTGLGSAHRDVAQWLLSNRDPCSSAPQDARQNVHPLDGAVTQHYNNPPPITDDLQTGAAQPRPALLIQSQNDGVVMQRASPSDSDDSVPSLESLSPEQKIAWKLSQEAARVQRSLQPGGFSPVSDDSVPSLESLSPGQKAAWKLSQEAALAQRAHRPQSSSPVFDDSVPSLESLSPEQKVAWKLSLQAARPEQSPRPQVSSSAPKGPVPGLEMHAPEKEGRVGENRHTAHQELSFQSMMQPGTDSPASDTTLRRLESVTAAGLQIREANKGAGQREWPGSSRTQQAPFSPASYYSPGSHPLTLPQNVTNFNVNQQAQAGGHLHRGMVQQPTVPPLEDNTSISKTLPAQDVFPQLGATQEAFPPTLLHSKAGRAAIMSHYPGKQMPNAKRHLIGNADIDAAASSQLHDIESPEIREYATSERTLPGRLHPPVAYTSQYSVATPSNEQPATGIEGAVSNGRDIWPVTASLRSDTRQVGRRTPLDILVSVASKFPQYHESRPDTAHKDLQQLNARPVQSHSPSNLSVLEASYWPSAHAPLPQFTNKDLELLNENTQVKVQPAELSPLPLMPWRHDSFHVRSERPTTYTQPPSMLSLPTQSNMSPMGLIPSGNHRLPYRETLQGPQISLDGRSNTSVAQQSYEHTPSHIRYEHPSAVQIPGEDTRLSVQVTQPAVAIQPFPYVQASQIPSSSNLVYGLSYPASCSTYRNPQRFPDSMPSFGSAQHDSSHMHPPTSLEQAIPPGSQEATSTSASYEHIPSHLSYQHLNIVQTVTVATGPTVEGTQHARIAEGSSSNWVYGPTYAPPNSASGNSQLLPNDMPYVGSTEQGNIYMHPERSLEQVISAESHPATSTSASQGIPPSSSQAFY